MNIYFVSILLCLQTTLLLGGIIYFRNKTRKDARRLNGLIQEGQKATLSQEKCFTKKLAKLIEAIGKLQIPVDDFHRIPREKQFSPHFFAILSLPKCGGSSIKDTLNCSFSNSKANHWHCYSLNAMQHFADIAENMDDEDGRNDLIRQLRQSVEFRTILNQADEKNVSFLAGVRDPISLGISLFFQQHFSGKEKLPEYSFDAIQHAVETSEGLWFDLLKLDQWFDENLLPASGHDVFAESFSADAGYRVYRGGKGSLAVYRLESRGSMIKAVAEMAQVPASILEIKKTNIADDKIYSARYREVVAGIKFSEDFINKIYQTRYATHFYSSSEIKQFKLKWSEKS